MKRLALCVLTFLAAAGAAQAYVVVLKDGSKVFARKKYEVRGSMAVITLENGNVTQIPVSRVDVPASDKYNKEYVGNVIAIPTPEEQTIANPPASSQHPESLGTYVRQHEAVMEKEKARAPSRAKGAAAPAAAPAADPILEREAARILGGAGITAYRTEGTDRVLVTADNEDAVFAALSTGARLAADMAGLGRTAPLHLVLATSTGAPAGTFDLTAEQVQPLLAGTMTPSEFFVENVIF